MGHPEVLDLLISLNNSPSKTRNNSTSLPLKGVVKMKPTSTKTVSTLEQPAGKLITLSSCWGLNSAQ